MHGHSSSFTFSLHIVRDPKAFINWFFKRSDHESWTMESDHGKRPSSMVRLHGPWCKPALRRLCGIYIKFIKKNHKITPYTWLDLETQGSWPTMPKITTPDSEVARFSQNFDEDFDHKLLEIQMRVPRSKHHTKYCNLVWYGILCHCGNFF